MYHLAVSVCSVARQQLRKHIHAAHTIEELLNTSFSICSMPYQRNVGDKFFPELLVDIVTWMA